tara:strand:- start:739 stop:2136 length:1398 start_codon:yes stop_codon:yes gene_type:complete
MFKLYNSYSNLIEKVNLDKNDVKVYLCGPTVQSSPHLGHGRSAVVFDFLIRYMKYLEYKVTYVRNITDIDDKIISKSNEEGISYIELGERVSDEFKKAYEELNCIKPNIEPKATEFIPEIIKYIDKLIENEFAYVGESGIYYNVLKYDDYLKLSGRTREEVVSGTRIEIEEDKKSPEDFALWKFSKEEEPYWESPWGNGRPGWHIECSSMIQSILGKTIDIHCGGNDLIFPHHENEIAQSKGAYPNEEFVKYWLHNGMLNLSGKKMSKSEGNIKLLHEYLDEFNGQTVRFFFLRSQYRSPQEFSLELLKESESTLNKIIDFTEDINPEPKNQNLLDIFEECMNEDLNTPKILGEIFKLINTSDTLDNQELLDLKSTIKYLFYVLGFDLAKKELTRKTDEEFEEFFKRNGKEFKNIEDSVNDFILERENLRNKKDYEAADKMRDEILEMGIILEDGVDGGWSWKSN